MMAIKSTVFDDIMQGLHEIEEYQKGNISLKSHFVTSSNDEIEMSQLLFRKFSELSELNKQRVVMYMDELLQATIG